MIIFQFIIDALATYRLARMIACESGPFDIFVRLRGHAKDWVADGLSCPMCLSVWLSFLIRFLPTRLRSSLALSACACLIYSLFDFERYFKK